ncbi:hypothetical protein F511_45532 [Dorcoceras hygrometricum]|uniref:Uncharacterized protein n=1 Tax=Dorcoceras hygrometricum TaxID=472368 RepID=A0A2Z6ZVR9_9LAMI|nr:hypothetical protein F511_45532 [Dorcoceras hygrometricum]
MTSPERRPAGGAATTKNRGGSARRRAMRDARPRATTRPATIVCPASLDQWRHQARNVRPARFLVTRPSTDSALPRHATNARPAVEIQARHGAISHDRPSAISREKPATLAAFRAEGARPVRASARGGERGPPHTAAAGWPTSKKRHFTVGGGRYRQSGPRPETRLLRQPALEGLTRSVRTDCPRRIGRKQFSGERSGGGDGL